PGNFTSTNDFEYFAHVVDNGGFNFRGRLYLAEYSETGFTPGITANKWKDGEEEVTKWGEELSYDTVYRAVIRYNGTATLWINPTASTSTSVTTTADATNGSVDVTSVNFRQGGASPDYTVTVDNVAVTESFNSAILTLDKNEAVSNIVVTVSNGVVTSNRGEIVAVYNTLGQKVANANLQGVYIVRVQDGAQVKAVKVLVK
ncbi:MAG: T9SS type A sorting domain-containing protein, partial [Flavicella sp.]